MRLSEAVLTIKSKHALKTSYIQCRLSADVIGGQVSETAVNNLMRSLDVEAEAKAKKKSDAEALLNSLAAEAKAAI